MSIEYVNCSHCNREHAVQHCDNCDAEITKETPGVFLGNVQFNNAARDQLRAAYEQSKNPVYLDRVGLSAANLCMDCATRGVDLNRLILADQRQWPGRTL